MKIFLYYTFFAICCSCLSQSAQAGRPNIILIVADDLGYGELGCQGNRDIPTPHIDSIAKNGVRFTNGLCHCIVL